MGRRPKKYRKRPYLKRHHQSRYWFAVFYDRFGKRQMKPLHTKNRDEAERKFARLLADVKRGLDAEFRPEQVTLPVAVRQYLTEGTSHLLPASIDRHERSFRVHVLPFFKGYSVRAIDAEAVEKFIAYRIRQGAAAATIHKEVMALSALLNFCRRRKLVEANPCIGKQISKPRIPKAQPKGLALQEVVALYANLFPGARRIFLVFVNTGCRKSELFGANVSSVDLIHRALTVLGKGAKIRTIPLNDVAYQQIRIELSSRPLVSPDAPLFLNREGKRYTDLRTPLESAARRAGIAKRVGHHTLRHTYGTLFCDDGGNVVHLQKLLGHEDVQTTMRYVRPFRGPIEEAAHGFAVDPRDFRELGKEEPTCPEDDENQNPVKH